MFVNILGTKMYPCKYISFSSDCAPNVKWPAFIIHSKDISGNTCTSSKVSALICL